MITDKMPLKFKSMGDTVLQINSCCANAEGKEASELLLKVGERPRVALARVTPERPFCKVSLNIEPEWPEVTFSVLGSGPILLLGVLSEGPDEGEYEENQPGPPSKRHKTTEGEKQVLMSGMDAPVTDPAKAHKPAAQPQNKASASAEKEAEAKPAPKAAAKAEPKVAAKVEAKADAKEPAKPVGQRQLPSGLKYEVLKAGKGQIAQGGRPVEVRYEGRLAGNGKRFDKGTIKFRLGLGEVIKGWDEGVKGMMVGEKRRLLIPAKLGYGHRGAPPDIPPNAALIFDVELLKV